MNLPSAQAAEISDYENELQIESLMKREPLSPSSTVEAGLRMQVIRDHVNQLDKLAVSFATQVLRMATLQQVPAAPYRVDDWNAEKERLLNLYEEVESAGVVGTGPMLKQQAQTDHRRIFWLAFTVLATGTATSFAIRAHQDFATIVALTVGWVVALKLVGAKSKVESPNFGVKTREQRKFEYFWDRVNRLTLGHGVQVQWKSRESVVQFCDRLLEDAHWRVPTQQQEEMPREEELDPPSRERHAKRVDHRG